MWTVDHHKSLALLVVVVTSVILKHLIVAVTHYIHACMRCSGSPVPNPRSGVLTNPPKLSKFFRAQTRDPPKRPSIDGHTSPFRVEGYGRRSHRCVVRPETLGVVLVLVRYLVLTAACNVVPIIHARVYCEHASPGGRGGSGRYQSWESFFEVVVGVVTTKSMQSSK